MNISPTPPRDERPWRGDFGWGLAVVAVSVFTIVYYTLVHAHLDRTLAMFVGVPCVLGVFAANTRPIGAVARSMKYLTLCLCIAAPLLGEGMICLAMSAPIAYPLVALVAWLASRGAARDKNIVRGIAIIPFLWAIFARTPIDERPVVEATDAIELDATPDQVWRALEHVKLPLGDELPLFLRIGFPSPRALTSGGLEVGAERRVVFDNGTVVAHVVEATPGVRFRVTLSYEEVGHEFFDRWIDLQDATFTLQPLEGGRTRLTHVTRYRRLLDPAIYFGPMEEAGVHLMQRYLLQQFQVDLARLESRR